MQIGDLVLISDGNSTLSAIGEITNYENWTAEDFINIYQKIEKKSEKYKNLQLQVSNKYLLESPDKKLKLKPDFLILKIPEYISIRVESFSN